MPMHATWYGDYPIIKITVSDRVSRYDLIHFNLQMQSLLAEANETVHLVTEVDRVTSFPVAVSYLQTLLTFTQSTKLGCSYMYGNISTLISLVSGQVAQLCNISLFVVSSEDQALAHLTQEAHVAGTKCLNS